MSCGCNGVLIIGGTNAITWLAPTNNLTGDQPVNLSVTYALYEASWDEDTNEIAFGDPVANATGSLSYSATPDPGYYGTLASTVALDETKQYGVVLTESSYGVVARSEVPVDAM